MELTILTVVAIAIVVVWVISLFSGKETKTVKKDIGDTIGVMSMKMRTDMHKSAVTSNLEWADDLLEEFGYTPGEAIKQSKAIQAQLIEPVTATKLRNTTANEGEE